MKRIVFAASARRDFAALVLRVAEESGVDAAARISLELQERIELLQTSPLMGHKGVLPTTREVVFDNLIVVYVVKDASIDVTRIWHAKQKRPFKR